MQSSELTPIFPLNTPIFPGCKMHLQIFEQRYLDMVSRCMRQGSGFIVALLCPGSEQQEVNRPGQAADDNVPFYLVGTYVVITDFGQLGNGLLSITIEGQTRQQLEQIRLQDNGLWIGTSHVISDEGELSADPPQPFRELLKELLELSGMNKLITDPHKLDSQQLMNYLIMLLPLASSTKQSLLTTNNLKQRCDDLLDCLKHMAQK